MQFLVLAFDATDAEALNRRLAARAAHMELVEKNKAAGHAHYGAAILSEAGQMVGSMMVVEYPDEDALKDWLAEEPYVTGNVWESIEVQPCRIAPAFADGKSAA